MATTESVANHPEIDWTNWRAPGPNDLRSPCPALNILANYGILPRDGKNITKAICFEALTKAYHLDSHLAGVFSSQAVGANPDKLAHTFDLDHLNKHGYIEHDVSLTREDAAFGSNSKVDKSAVDALSQVYENAAATDPKALADTSKGPRTNWKAASQARFNRVKVSKARHEKAGKHWHYGLKEAVMSYGETSLYLSLLGQDGVAPVEWVNLFFAEERLPVAEGWTAPEHITQSMLNHAYARMISAHPAALQEAQWIGLGTFEAMWTGIMSLSSLIKAPGASPKEATLGGPTMNASRDTGTDSVDRRADNADEAKVQNPADVTLPAVLASL